MKFNKTLEAVNIMVMASYPAARFYEAQGILIEENNSFIPEVSGPGLVDIKLRHSLKFYG